MRWQAGRHRWRMTPRRELESDSAKHRLKPPCQRPAGARHWLPSWLAAPLAPGNHSPSSLMQRPCPCRVAHQTEPDMVAWSVAWSVPGFT